MSGINGEIPEWARRCPSGKTKYTSKKDAELRGFGSWDQRSMRGYRCELCGYWHNSRAERKKRRVIERNLRRIKRNREEDEGSDSSKGGN